MNDRDKCMQLLAQSRTYNEVSRQITDGYQRLFVARTKFPSESIEFAAYTGGMEALAKTAGEAMGRAIATHLEAEKLAAAHNIDLESIEII